MPEKLILDTDIGTDVDDAWALTLCLASPEIDLLGVTLVHADLDTRAKIALKMLRLADRTQVPVYKGKTTCITEGARLYWAGHEGTGTDFSDIDVASARDGAVDFILETIERFPGEIILCPIGPMTNVAAAIIRSPETMRKLKRLVVMGTTFNGEGREAASREHNGCVDAGATKISLESGIPATIVGLNVTMQVSVNRADVRGLRGSPFGDYLADMTDQYFGVAGRDHTYMHDPLAVATLVDSDVVQSRRMRAEVMEDGSVAYTSARRDAPAAEDGALDVAVSVDADRFGELLMQRVYSLARRRENN